MSIKINRLEEGHNSYPLVCWRPAEAVPLQRRQICYRWGTPAYWSLVPRSSMFYLFEFCLKNMWNCSPTQQILSHSFYDWKLYELFLLSGFLICYAVGWYIELKNQKFWWRIPERKILISDMQQHGQIPFKPRRREHTIAVSNLRGRLPWLRYNFSIVISLVYYGSRRCNRTFHQDSLPTNVW